MKIALLFFLVLPITSFSQKANKKDISTTTLDSIVYDLTPKTLAPSSIFLPFSKIQIIDARYDTSKLGYEIHQTHDFVNSNDFKKIKLNKGIYESIQLFYNDYYSLCLKDTMNKLLIVLKTLWIDNVPSGYAPVESSKISEHESYQNIHVKWEYYIQRKNKYYPFKRIDTIYQLTQSIISSNDFKFKKNDLSFFIFVLKSQLEQIDFSSIGINYENKKSLSFSSIDSFNRRRLLLPIINASTVQNGLFLNFEEFKNNNPGVVDYEVKKVKKERLWINRENLKIIEDFYLVSDSSGIHIGSEKRRSVVPVGNTFEFFSLGSVSQSKTLAGLMLNLMPIENYIYSPYQQFQRRFDSETGTIKIYLVPRQINMETGEVY